MCHMRGSPFTTRLIVCCIMLHTTKNICFIWFILIENWSKLIWGLCKLCYYSWKCVWILALISAFEIRIAVVFLYNNDNYSK